MRITTLKVLFLSLIFSGSLQAQNIINVSTPSLAGCQCDTIPVSFTVSSALTAGNQFKVEMSDGLGSFNGTFIDSAKVSTEIAKRVGDEGLDTEKKKREETEKNKNEGFISISTPKKSTVYNPNNVARTTIKETTIDNFHTGNFKGPQKMTKYNPEEITRTTIKETTIDNKRDGNVGDTVSKHNGYTYEDLPKITVRNTSKHIDTNVNLKPNNPEKNTQFPNQPIRITTKETTVKQKFLGQPSKEQNDGYKVANLRVPYTIKQATIKNKHNGIANSRNKKHINTEFSDNFNLNNIKEKVLKRRNPTNNGAKQFIRCDNTVKDIVNPKLKRDNKQNMNPSNIEGPNKITSKESYNNSKTKKFIKTSSINDNRLINTLIPKNDLSIRYRHVNYDDSQKVTEMDRYGKLTNNEEILSNSNFNENKFY